MSNVLRPLIRPLITDEYREGVKLKILLDDGIQVDLSVWIRGSRGSFSIGE